MARIGDYFRAAVLHPWNLVMLGSGLVASLGLGTEVPAMLAAGVELAYLGVVPASARFRRAVDARVARRDRRLEGSRLDAMVLGSWRIQGSAFSRVNSLWPRWQ